MRRHVVIGNSHAAIAAVEAIRRVDAGNDIVLIARELGVAYSPALLTYYLAGRLPYEGIFFCREDFYRAHRVEMRLGTPVVSVHPASRTVVLADGASVPYDDLLIATGSVPWVPPVPGTDLAHVFTLWTAADAARIARAAGAAERVAVVGAGLIGIQLLGAMIARGKRVSLVEMLGQIMPLALDAEGSRMVDEVLVAGGVDLHLDERVARIDTCRRGLSVSLASGRAVEADMVILATGVRPNAAWLDGSGVTRGAGVVVNEYCETNVPGIYAAGDVAEGTDAATGVRRVNATLLNAAEQGRVAGLNMAGTRVPCLRTVRVNAFAVHGVPCASAGLTRGLDGRRDSVSHASGRAYRTLIFDGERLVGMVLVGDVDLAGVLARMIERGDPCRSALDGWARGRASRPPAEMLGVAPAFSLVRPM